MLTCLVRRVEMSVGMAPLGGVAGVREATVRGRSISEASCLRCSKRVPGK